MVVAKLSENHLAKNRLPGQAFVGRPDDVGAHEHPYAEDSQRLLFEHLQRVER